MVLTPTEIAALTGRRQRAAQARVLDALGVRYARRPDGTLVVLQAALAALAGGATLKKSLEPEWGKM